MDKSKVVAALTALAALAACGGSNTGNPVVDSPNVDEVDTAPVILVPTPVLAVNESGAPITAREALESGVVLGASGTSTSALLLDYNENTTGFQDATLLVSFDDDGNLVTNINGRETVFTDADRDGDDGFERDLEPGFVGIFGQSDPLQEALAEGDGYVTGVTYILTDDSGPGLFSYAVIGTQTPTDAVPSGTASYDGTFKAEVVPATEFNSFGGQRSQFRGDTAISVTMDGNISGVINDLEFRAPGEDDRISIDGSIAMSSASITDGTFGGDLTADAALLAEDDLNIIDAELGTYNGLFFGPNGEEVAGTVELTVQTSDGVQNGVGFFQAD